MKMGHVVGNVVSTRKVERLVGNKLPDTGNLECCFLDDIGYLCQVTGRNFLQRAPHNAGTGNADIDHTIRLARAVECPRHKRIVLRRVAEYNQFRGADTVFVRRGNCRLFDDTAH